MPILNVSAQKPDSTGGGTYPSALVRSLGRLSAEPPAMLDVDTPDPAALPAFEERLARAIEHALAAPTPVCDPVGVSWGACSARILEVAKTLKGGIHGTR